jgi:hypothetical protein
MLGVSVTSSGGTDAWDFKREYREVAGARITDRSRALLLKTDGPYLKISDEKLWQSLSRLKSKIAAMLDFRYRPHIFQT